MPTFEQLCLLMEADLEVGLRESEYNVRGSSNAFSNRLVKKFTGTHLGYLVYDEENDDFKIVRDNEVKEKGKV